jgi:hypothetical protein
VTANPAVQEKRNQLIRFSGLALLLAPYLLYLGFIIWNNRGPIDYETFMEIGQRLLSGGRVYGINSYYPMPFVIIFGLFSALPRPLSMALWLLLPLACALLVSGWRPSTLLFAPVFGHFVGGQTAVFGMLGLWGYRRNTDPDKISGGIWLALTLVKPQLGLLPLAYAAVQWWRALRKNKRIPRQAWAWLGSMAVLFLPGFIILPDWLQQWLQSPRPLSARAMSGFIPRTLYLGLASRPLLFWLAWGALSLGLLALVWRLNHRRLTLDLLVLWGFIASPLVHDYDLLQIVPMLETRWLRWGAVLLSIPGWLVILTAYSNDAAWYVFTLIAPGLLALLLYSLRSNNLVGNLPVVPLPGPSRWYQSSHPDQNGDKDQKPTDWNQANR